MGCNTSKDAMQPGADSTTAASAAPAATATTTTENMKSDDALEPVMDTVQEVKTILDDVIAVPEVTPPNCAKPEMERLENAISQKVETTLTEQVDKAKEATDKFVKNVSNINLNDPEANRAATKIQAAFRGHKTRKSMKQGDAESKENLDKEFSSDDKELCEAATKIQASFRGHLVRKSAPRKDEEEELSRELKKLDAKAPEEELDIDLTDPDLQVAATKIQASFRGHRVRKEKQGGGNE